MGQINKTLSVIYRACHLEVSPNSIRNLSRPDWFCKKKCWASFYDEFGHSDMANEHIEITVVFDGNKDHELAKYISGFKIKDIIYLDEAGNKGSLIYCYNLMGKLGSEYCAIFEDDYLWLSDSYKILMEGLERFGQSGTISLYQHPDRLTRTDDITLGRDYILSTNSCYWRTAESNTATFAINTELFKKYQQEFVDCHVNDRLLFVNLLKKYDLRHFTPVSERYGCCHVNRFFQSFYIDWEKFNNSIKI